MSITRQQIENRLAAFGHAERLGLRLNVTLDIHFHRGGLHDPAEDAAESLRRLLKSSRQWIERKGCQTAVIWTFENQADDRPSIRWRCEDPASIGIHAHVLVHVPPRLLTRWHQLKRRWIRKAGLDAAKKGVVNFEPVQSLNGAKGKLFYMSKDAHPEVLAIFEPFINPRTGKPWIHDSGKPSNAPVLGKKTGVSRNIDAKARASYRSAPGRADVGLAGASEAPAA